MQRPAYLWPSWLVAKAYHGKYETGGVPIVSSAEDFCESMRIDWPKSAFRPIGTEGILAGLRLVLGVSCLSCRSSFFFTPFDIVNIEWICSVFHLITSAKR